MKDIFNLGGPTATGGPFISEIHYDNTGADVGEFVEICIPPGTSVAGFQLVLYNGSNGTTYNTTTLTDPDPVACPPASDGNTYLVVTPSASIQNGAPDGLALVNSSGAVCEFLSYEGTITATNGPANGMTSTDIGVSESSGTAIGESLQLDPATGLWQTPMAETPKNVNICFYSGTRIQTLSGYKKIETLKVGDIVATASGKSMPIKWVGVQSVILNSDRDILKSNPVLIQQNALGEGVPSANLRVSPNHAIYVDGLLINAGALVNGVNIIQESPIEDFKYYHIELDSHELVIAENTSAESYLPQKENRDDFDNAAEFDLQYPEGRKLILWPLDYPRISSQAKVPDYIKDKILRKEEIRKIA